jgi:hypothetical protein
VGLFLAWAIARGLVDESSLAKHARLLADVKSRAARGSALVDAALDRGLWDRHLRDEPGLRDFAFGWFHNVGKAGYITKSLNAVFGARSGPYGHDEPILDEDDWPAVDKATPALDEVFARWVKS